MRHYDLFSVQYIRNILSDPLLCTEVVRVDDIMVENVLYGSLLCFVYFFLMRHEIVAVLLYPEVLLTYVSTFDPFLFQYILTNPHRC